MVGLFSGVGFFALLDFAFYVLAGCGVRRRSRTAAVVALTTYTLGDVALQLRAQQGFGIVRIIFIAVLLANVRGIWLSASWPEPVPEPDAPAPLTFFDWISDRLPFFLSPRMAWLFYILAALELLGLSAILFPIAPNTGLNG